MTAIARMPEKIKPTKPVSDIIELRTPSSMSILLRFPEAKLFLSILNNDSEIKKQIMPSRIEVIEIRMPPMSKPTRKFLTLFSIMSTETPQTASRVSRQTSASAGVNSSPNQNSVLTSVRREMRNVRCQNLNSSSW